MPLTPAEIEAAIQAFQLLEPEVQKGVAGLIHLLYKKPPTAADFIAQAQQLLSQQPSLKQTP